MNEIGDYMLSDEFLLPPEEPLTEEELDELAVQEFERMMRRCNE